MLQRFIYCGIHLQFILNNFGCRSFKTLCCLHDVPVIYDSSLMKNILFNFNSKNCGANDCKKRLNTNWNHVSSGIIMSKSKLSCCLCCALILFLFFTKFLQLKILYVSPSTDQVKTLNLIQPFKKFLIQITWKVYYILIYFGLKFC